MRISRDKLNKLAHTVADSLAEIGEVDFLEDRNTIRQEARKFLEVLMAEETKIDQAARLKISSRAGSSRKARRSGTFFTGSTTTMKSAGWVCSRPERVWRRAGFLLQ